MLSLSSIHLSDEAIITLIKALEKSEDILEVDLSRCQLEQEELISFIKALKSEEITVRHLKLDQVPLGRILLMHLALALKENHFIRKINLQWCRLGEDVEAASAFFMALGQNDTLEHVDISSNNIMSSLGKTLALSLKGNYNVRIIDLSWNKIGESGGLALAEMLKVNKSIQKIHLDGNDVSGSTLLTIESQLHHNLTLHMKHAELISKSLSFHNELNVTRENLSEQLENLKCDYADLESRGIAQQESLLFQMGQLEEQLKSKNKDLGVLVEQQALTVKALAVAEERIAFLEMVDKRRDEHFKELQTLCAEHEKAHQEESFKRESELENLLQAATKEANEAKLKATKARDDFDMAKAHNEHLQDNLENLTKEKEVMIESHEKVIQQINVSHKGMEEEWRERRRQAKEDNDKMVKELEQKHLEQIKEESDERSRLRQQISDLQNRIEGIQVEHQKSKTQMMQKFKVELEQNQADRDASIKSLKMQIERLETVGNENECAAKAIREKGYVTEIELEKSKQVIKDLQNKVEEYERDKEHIRDLIRLEFEKEVNESIKSKDELHKMQVENESLQTELKTIKETFETEKQALVSQISELEASLQEQQNQLEKQRYEKIFTFISKTLSKYFAMFQT